MRALDRRKDSSAKKTIRGGCSRGRARRFVRGSGSMGFVAVLVILWDSVTTASASFGIERWGGIGEVEGTSGRSRLVKSSPPHCLQYLVEARSSSSVRVARESSISIATRTSHRLVTPRAARIGNPIFLSSPRPGYTFLTIYNALSPRLSLAGSINSSAASSLLSFFPSSARTGEEERGESDDR